MINKEKGCESMAEFSSVVATSYTEQLLKTKTQFLNHTSSFSSIHSCGQQVLSQTIQTYNISTLKVLPDSNVEAMIEAT